MQPLLLVLLATLAAASTMKKSAETRNAASVSRPNIILLVSDDTGYGDPSSFGNPVVHTPNIDRMVNEGAKMTQFYVASPICSASRSAFLTGRIPLRTGIWSNTTTMLNTFGVDAGGGLPTDETTIATKLREQDYATMLIGKWHLGQKEEHMPLAHGYDEYLGIPYCHNQCPCPRGFPTEKYIECIEPKGVYTPPLPCPVVNGTTVVQQPANMEELTPRYITTAQNFIERNSKSNRPFFLHMGFAHTHAWNFAGPGFWGKSARGSYGDSLLEMDWAIGQILDAVQDSEAARNTLVFWTSDNGAAWPHRNEHAGSTGLLQCGKGTNFEGGVRVPAVAWWPGVIKPRLEAQPWSAVDLFPTFAALSGASPLSGKHLDGTDVSEMLLEGATLPDTPALWWYNSRYLSAACFGPYKVHWYTQGWGESWVLYPECGANYLQKQDPPLLFQVEHDPSERFPISPNSEEYRKVMSDVNAARQKHEASLSDDIGKPQIDVPAEPETQLCCPGQKPVPPYTQCTCGQNP